MFFETFLICKHMVISICYYYLVMQVLEASVGINGVLQT